MASTNGNILKLPFRRATQLSLSATIRRYISDKYDQHPDMFKQDLQAIDQLRRDAVNVQEPHPSGIAKLTSYAAQLVWIGGKFPIDIGADFTWYPALGYNTEHPLVQNNMKYELMNVLYNLAALYAQLAINTPRGNTDGLKTAANYFSLAAGILSHMQAEVLPDLRMPTPPDDMDDHTLECLKQLMLSQSQECFWQKAVMDGYKDASIAKLAARVSDLYNLAAEAAVQSEAISSAWIHHMTVKHHHFAAAAQYRAACDCLEKRRFGEEVSRLKDAVACVNEGMKATRGGFVHRVVVEDLQGLKRRVEEDLKRAEKDNDVIYLQSVPPKSELRILDRANMAVARTPKQVSDPYESLGEDAEFGPALFSRLVPFSVHMAISIYEERRDHTVNQDIIQPLEAMTENMHSILTSLGLPGSLQALEKPIGLPQSLVQHAEEIRQDDAMERLQRGLEDIQKLRSADLTIFQEGREALAADAEEDERFRRKYGTDRWRRPEANQLAEFHRLKEMADSTEGYFAQGLDVDNLIRDRFAAIEERLGVLSSPDRVIMDYVPSSRRPIASEELKVVVGRLRSTYNDILRLESRRRKKVQSLRDSAKRDDIKPDILKEAARLERAYPTTALVPAHFEDFFEKRLDTLYEREVEALQDEQSQQDKLLEQVQRNNREFESQKRLGSDRSTRDRQEALQALEDAYKKYKELIGNLEAARKFYNDLNKIVGPGFRDVVRQYAAGRRREAQELEEEINMPPLSNLNISRGQSPPPQADQYYSQPSQANAQAWAPEADVQDNVQQPQPVAPAQNVWNPNMGLRFGSPAQGQQQSRQPQDRTWNPASGIRFG